MSREPIYRPWWEVRWRQLKNPPPPVFRAVVADLLVAAVAGALLLAYALSGPPESSLSLAVLLLIGFVVIVGSVLTYLWVELPTGASGVRRRSGWSAVIGLFASLPICYLVVVLVLQVLVPILR